MYKVPENLKKQIYFVIAAYNEGNMISTVLVNLFDAGYDNLIVIDDCSKDHTVKVVTEVFQLLNKGTLLKQEVNQGQGAALRRGINEALTHHDCKYIVTFDSDGQHRIEDIGNFIEPLEQGKCDLALGSRFLLKETEKLVHAKKLILLKGATILTNLISGLKLTDTNNGYRVFNRYAAINLPIRADRYEHASILLEDMARKKIRHIEVPTHIYYSPYSIEKGQKIRNSINILNKLIRHKLRQHKLMNKSKNDKEIKNKPTKKPTRITFACQYFRPLCNPPSKRLGGFAEHLNGYSKHQDNQEYEVKVITGQPNYGTGKLMEGYTGLNWFFKKEEINGVPVYHFPEIPTKNEGFVKRLINYLSFAASSIFSFPLIMKSDIVFISSPPLFSAIPIFYLSKLFGKKTIFDIRDMWPESTVEVVGVKKGLAYNILFKIVNDMYDRTDLITCVSNQMKKKLISYGLEGKKIEVLYNFASKQNHFKFEEHDVFSNEKIKLVYTGILSNIQDLEPYLELNKSLIIQNKFEFHIAGDGEMYNKLVEQCKDYKNVKFYGYVSKEKCNELIQSADMCIVPLVEKDLFRMALPSKIMEYTSYGKPIIANWSKEVEEIMKKYNFGYYIDKFNIDDDDSICAVKQLLFSIDRDDLNEKSKEARRVFDDLFDRRIVCNRFEEIIDNINIRGD